MVGFIVCQKQSINCWAIITAYNPKSELQADAENQRANQQLLQVITDGGFSTLPGDGVPASESWSTELGYFICNISQSRATELAKQFKQNAIIISGEKNLAKLLWII
ncbi:DUF3293 domain-containing protein [Pelagibaculum spongiae]|uniref:DUF3293 domain-containing protein n=1 Tax=Pelagibaculum spongiae TaxID=2080658 RepID=A0A2V1GNN2_9GAMM|nr:DUF3293 domain-containing protein [Pelagibaculum spongiae]PVZ63453.1 hypothetical protein DC094_21335 [Pelagibaculum spongiae]